MTKFNTSHLPPAAVAEVTLRNTASLSTIRNIPMLVDTGSDITIIPRESCNVIGVTVDVEPVDLIAFDGSIGHAYLAYLDLIFSGKVVRGDFLIYDQDEGILGRDILNKFKILLDGPRSEWEVVSEPSSNAIS